MTDKVEGKVIGERGGCIRSIIPRDIRMTRVKTEIVWRNDNKPGVESLQNEWDDWEVGSLLHQ